MDCPITTQYQPALAAFSALNQQRILHYLALLAARRYVPLRIPRESCHRFQVKPATDSTRKLPPVPHESCH